MILEWLVLAVIGVIILPVGLYYFHRKRLMENIPTSKIRSLAMGPVEVFGHVECWQNTFLISPFSQKDCVYYRYYVEELRRSGKHSHWVTIKSDIQMVHFLVRDDTGAVLVNPRGAHLDIPKDFAYQSSFGKDPPIEVQRFLQTNNISFESFFGFNKNMRFREYILQPGDPLYVFGAAGDNPFVDEASAQQGVEDVMIQKGKHSSFFYISDKHESKIVQKYSILSYLFLGVGAAMVIIGLTFMFIGR